MLLMCDVADLGHGVVAGRPDSWGAVVSSSRAPSPEAVLAAAAAPHLILYDRTPGGAGLAISALGLGRELFGRAAAIVANCSCSSGCPTCMGPAGDDAFTGDRSMVVEILHSLAGVAGSLAEAR
jgi:DEAD/DEAH box helicase domain-containing protein